MAPAVLALEVKGLCGNDSINAANLITYFPTDFKQIIWFDKFCFHVLTNYLFTPARTFLEIPSGDIKLRVNAL